MFATSLIGFLSGIIFEKEKWKEHQLVLSTFGFIVTLVLYGGIMNFYATLSYTDQMTKEVILATYAQGFPLDLIHAISTFAFLFLMAKPLIQRLERVKVKYHIMEK